MTLSELAAVMASSELVMSVSKRSVSPRPGRKNWNLRNRATHDPTYHATFRYPLTFPFPAVCESKQSAFDAKTAKGNSKKNSGEGKNPKKGAKRDGEQSPDMKKHKTPKMPPPPPGSRMNRVRVAKREGAAKNLRGFFQGRHYQARLKMTIAQAYKNVWPQLEPLRKTD